jgi:hypothetical protein
MNYDELLEEMDKASAELAYKINQLIPVRQEIIKLTNKLKEVEAQEEIVLHDLGVKPAPRVQAELRCTPKVLQLHNQIADLEITSTSLKGEIDAYRERTSGLRSILTYAAAEVRNIQS